MKPSKKSVICLAIIWLVLHKIYIWLAYFLGYFLRIIGNSAALTAQQLFPFLGYSVGALVLFFLPFAYLIRRLASRAGVKAIRVIATAICIYILAAAALFSLIFGILLIVR